MKQEDKINRLMEAMSYSAPETLLKVAVSLVETANAYLDFLEEEFDSAKSLYELVALMQIPRAAELLMILVDISRPEEGEVPSYRIIEGTSDGSAEKPADAASKLYAKIFRGLADPTRVHIVRLLLEQPRTVGELVDMLGSPQGRVSSHVAWLRWCGFVEGVRAGRNVTYEVTDARVRALLETAHHILQDNAQR